MQLVDPTPGFDVLGGELLGGVAQRDGCREHHQYGCDWMHVILPSWMATMMHGRRSLCRGRRHRRDDFLIRLSAHFTANWPLLQFPAGGAYPHERNKASNATPLQLVSAVAPGVEVGQVSLVSGQGPLRVGVGPVRRGVTVIFPRGRANSQPVYGGFFDLNGNGEMTGRSYLPEFGVIEGPIGITNTNAIGQVYAGIQSWTQQRFGEAADPVVAETWDGELNDIRGFHVRPETAIAAIEAAKSGAIVEGSVGGGTGMECFGFKGGIGTASRKIALGAHAYMVGALVQCNTGDRKVLRIAGAPVGQALSARWLPCYDSHLSPPGKRPKCAGSASAGTPPPDAGSIIIVVGTNAPLIPTQLDRLAKRAAMGLARLG